ncbi:hypothetical protein GCM10007094_43620 [Pseudovibrio japonicus]|uniref:Uncharacterized protein n=1 Tax=Pseudovibrio japonicus TaxID=366534 RepID=A0ABQ3ETT5_9HYPH|nr:hypothetical protein GCM10007094_43620 [Pseudovibrio japonicus]
MVSKAEKIAWVVVFKNMDSVAAFLQKGGSNLASWNGTAVGFDPETVSNGFAFRGLYRN